VGPRAGPDGRKISSPPGFDPRPSNPYSVAIPTELPGPHCDNQLWQKYKVMLASILGGDTIGHCEKKKVHENMCLILNGYRDTAV